MRDIGHAALQNIVHYHFREVKLLEEALTHSSFANEQGLREAHNERLEFLGDAVLELAVTEELYRRFPECREGELTRMRSRLVNKPTLADLARQLGLDSALSLGRGEEVQGGRDRRSILSDALEALLGAVFLDGGWEAARAWIIEILDKRWPRAPEMHRAKDYKSLLQELTQEYCHARPMYVVEGSSGPEHAKYFTVRLTMPTGESVKASGSSVKKAEQKAAGIALERFGITLRRATLEESGV
ncbi:Ribonuclease 3 [Desulfovibrionales bacterium]